MALIAVTSLLETVQLLFNNFQESLFKDRDYGEPSEVPYSFSKRPDYCEPSKVKDTVDILVEIINNLRVHKYSQEEELRIVASEADYILQGRISEDMYAIFKDTEHLWKDIGMTQLLKCLGLNLVNIQDLVTDSKLLKDLCYHGTCRYLPKSMSSRYTYVYNHFCHHIFSNYCQPMLRPLDRIEKHSALKVYLATPADLRILVLHNGFLLPKLVISNEFHNYTISGSESLGKTAVARQIYSFYSYFNVHVWLNVSKGEQLHEMLQRLLQSVLDCIPGTDAYQLGRHKMSIQELCKCIFNWLVKRTYIIVIHNIPECSSIWDDIKGSFPGKENDGIVLLLTTSAESKFVCSIPNLKSIYQWFSHDEDRVMFNRLVFGSRRCPKKLKILRDGILDCCRFSPLSIIMVAEYLSSIGQTMANWQKVKQNIESSLLRYEDRRCSIILALLKASEDICSNKKQSAIVHYNTVESETNQIEKYKHLGTSSGVVADKEYISVGVEESMEQLLPSLMGSSLELGILTIVGMAGIGKTTLAKRVYDDPRISMHFDIRAWINVSQSYDRREILIQLLQQVNKLTDDNIHRDNDAIGDIICRSLKQRRYLIVMDDVWGIEVWNDLKRSFPDDNTRSRILVTSREENVIKDAKLITSHRLNLLSAERSWDMLQKMVFETEIFPPDLLESGKQIAKNCRGLPLAIVVIAGVLSKISKEPESWKGVAKSVSALVMSDQNPCQTIFNLSYEHLPGHLKSCFLYMGAFPRGSEIKVQTLVWLWEAEGFIIQEDVGEDYLNEFVDRSLILAGKRSSNGRLKTCHLHDLLVDFCIQKAGKEKFQNVVKDFAEMQSEGRMVDKGCRFSFQFCSFNDAHLATPISLAGSALFFGVRYKEIGDILLYYLNFKLLHTLDITPLRFDYFPSEQVSKLLLLRYLALTATFELPSVVFKLMKLQTLIVNGPWIRNANTPVLPPDFWRCTNLRHLQLRMANYLAPPETPTHPLENNSLQFLQDLSNVTIASCNQDSFACIPNLIKLVVFETLEDYNCLGLWDGFFKSLMLLTNLQSLKVSCYLNNMRPLPISSENTFPQNLRELTLRRSYLPWEAMMLLGALPNLRVLKLRTYAFKGAEWETGEFGFEELRYLLIEETDLMVWNLESDDCFPHLEHLVLKSCKKLNEIPREIGFIPRLTHIELHSCSHSAEHSAKEIQVEQLECYSNELNISIRTNRIL